MQQGWQVLNLQQSAAAEQRNVKDTDNGNGSVPVSIAFRRSTWCQGAERFPFCDRSKRCMWRSETQRQRTDSAFAYALGQYTLGRDAAHMRSRLSRGKRCS